MSYLSLLPALIVALCIACAAAPSPESLAVPDITGEWSIAWEEGYEYESLTVRKATTPVGGYSLEYSRSSCFIVAKEFEKKALLIGGAILLDVVYNEANNTYIALAVDFEDGEMILVPYPSPNPLAHLGEAPVVYRRSQSP